MNRVHPTHTLVSPSQVRLGAVCAFSWLAATGTALHLGGISGALAGAAILVAVPATALALLAARTRD